jgi:hypothetical protein
LQTEQAHSSRAYPLEKQALGSGEGTPLAPQSIDGQANRPPRQTQHASLAEARSPLVWLNLVCLDAPLVSVTWLWLFARTFHHSLPLGSWIALFLTAWSIYLADRLADTRSLPEDALRSLRHQFCLRHRQIWIGALIVIAMVDLLIIWNFLEVAIFMAGSLVGALALAHLLLNYSLGGAWPPLPLKEVAVGSLFAAGTLVPLFPLFRPVTNIIVLAAVIFAALCTLNCLCIAFWERELDEIQGKVSFATQFPTFNRYLERFLFAFAFAAGATAVVINEVAPVLASASVSSFLLAILSYSGERFSRNQRTALADLVLLTPLLALTVMKP